MKALYKIAATLFFLSLISGAANAAHIIGGYMRYDCLGGSNYRFTLILFRDCYSGGSLFDSDFTNGAPFAGTVTLYLGNSTVPLQIIELGAPQIELVPLPSYCSSQPGICLERGVYSFDATLPDASQAFHAVYQRCCRAFSISNILQPAGAGATYCITITPEAQNLCNSSPIFINPMMVCSNPGLPYFFDHGAGDFDGDSIAYEFCAPFIGGGNDQINPENANGVAPNPDMPPPYDLVSFNEPTYSATQPIPGAPAFSIDTLTGEVTGIPNVFGNFLYGVCAKEYRNGQLISETKFEFIHNVTIATSTHEPAKLGQLKIRPNPANLEFSIELPKSNLPFDAKLLDINGQLKDAQTTVTGQTMTFSASNLAPGIYVVMLRNGQDSYIERIVVY